MHLVHTDRQTKRKKVTNKQTNLQREGYEGKKVKEWKVGENKGEIGKRKWRAKNPMNKEAKRKERIRERERNSGGVNTGKERERERE